MLGVSADDVFWRDWIKWVKTDGSDWLLCAPCRDELVTYLEQHEARRSLGPKPAGLFSRLSRGQAGYDLGVLLGELTRSTRVARAGPVG